MGGLHDVGEETGETTNNPEKIESSGVVRQTYVSV